MPGQTEREKVATMNKEFCRRHGISEGYNIAMANRYELDPRDTDTFVTECFEKEDNARQYSPFEFFARDVNDSRDPDGLWQAYDEGVSTGINRAVREIKKGLKDNES